MLISAFRPQIAVRLLAHKIQSPQEKEALQALTVSNPHLNMCCITQIRFYLLPNISVFFMNLPNVSLDVDGCFISVLV